MYQTRTVGRGPRAVGRGPWAVGRGIPRAVGRGIPRAVGRGIPRAVGRGIPRAVGRGPRAAGQKKKPLYLIYVIYNELDMLNPMFVLPSLENRVKNSK